MDAKEIETKVVEIVCGQFGYRELIISSETKFVDDLGADSLDLIEIIMMLEDVFNLDFDDKESVTLHTVGEVAQFIAWKLGAEPRRPFFLDRGVINPLVLGANRPV